MYSSTIQPFPYQSPSYNALTLIFWQLRNRESRVFGKEKYSFSLFKVLLLWVKLTPKWMIQHSGLHFLDLCYQSPLAFHCFHLISWFMSSFQFTSKILILALWILSLLLLVPSAICSLLLLVAFRPWPLFSSLDVMAHYFSNTFILPLVVFFFIFTALLSIFSVLAASKEMSRESHTMYIINSWLITTSGLRVVLCSSITLFKMFCHLIKLLFGSAEQTLRVIHDPTLSITLHFQPDRNLYDFIS